MKRYHYVEESDDLKLARQKDAEQYREFLKFWNASFCGLVISEMCRRPNYALPFSDLCDAQNVTA